MSNAQKSGYTFTSEVGTEQTDEGKRAAALWRTLKRERDHWGAGQYLNMLERGLRLVGDGQKEFDFRSVMEVVASAVKGRDVLEDADYGYGSFEETVSPNLRFPIPDDFTSDEIIGVVAIVSQGLKQEAGAASRFDLIEYEVEIGDDPTTYSVYVPAGRPPTLEEIECFEAAIRYPVNVEVIDDGFVIDILPFPHGGNGEMQSPELGRVCEAVRAVFDSKNGGNQHEYRILQRLFLSEYIESHTYDASINKLIEQRDVEETPIGENSRRYLGRNGSGSAPGQTGNPENDSRGDAKNRDPNERARAINDALSSSEDVGRRVGKLFTAFIEEVDERMSVRKGRRSLTMS